MKLLTKPEWKAVSRVHQSARVEWERYYPGQDPLAGPAGRLVKKSEVVNGDIGEVKARERKGVRFAKKNEEFTFERDQALEEGGKVLGVEREMKKVDGRLKGNAPVRLP